MTVFSVYVHPNDSLIHVHGTDYIQSVNYLISSYNGSDFQFDIATGIPVETNSYNRVSLITKTQTQTQTVRVTQSLPENEIHTPKLIAVRLDGNNGLDNWYNNISATPSSESDTSNISFNFPSGYQSFSIASRKSGHATTGFKGHIGELIMIKKALTNQEISNVLTDLNTKWGLGF